MPPHGASTWGTDQYTLYPGQIGGRGEGGRTRFLKMFLSQSQSHLYAGTHGKRDIRTNGKSSLVLFIQQPKWPMQLSGKGSVGPNLHTGSIRVLEGHKTSGWEDHLPGPAISLLSTHIQSYRRRSCPVQGFSWGTLSPARNLLRQQRTWSRRRRHTSPITNNTLPFTISTCIFTMTENRKILPHPPNFTVIIFLSAPNLIPLSQEQTEQI